MSIPPLLAECARLAVAYAESAAVRQASQAKRRFGYVTVLAIGAVVTGIASAACALTALWIGLLPFFGPVGAPSIVAGILGGVCLCLVGLMRRRRRPDAVPKPPDGQSAIPLLIGGLLAGLAMGSAPKS